MNKLHWNRWKATTGASKAKWLAILVRDNEPLVHRFATRFLDKTAGPPAHLRVDVFQAARIGLLRAIEKWDPALGAFSTVAWYLMRKEMQLAMRHATVITIPDRVLFTRPDKCDQRAALQAKAAVRFTGLRDLAAASDPDAPGPEETIDRAREARALRKWMAKISAAEREDLIAEKPAAMRRARVFIENAKKP